MDYGYQDVADLVKDLDFQTLLNTTAEEYLAALGINERFSQEILQSATRGNYCQDLKALHAFAVMVSMEAGHGTWAVEEGNYRIFEEFAARSESTIKLKTKVTAVSNITEIDTLGHSATSYVVETEDGETQVFDDIVLATPVKFSGIQFSFPVREQHRNYHVVHVTLVAGYPDPSYFGRTIDDMPTFVVSTGGSLGKKKKCMARNRIFFCSPFVIIQLTSFQIEKHHSIPFLFIDFWRMEKV